MPQGSDQPLNSLIRIASSNMDLGLTNMVKIHHQHICIFFCQENFRYYLALICMATFSLNLIKEVSDSEQEERGITRCRALDIIQNQFESI